MRADVIKLEHKIIASLIPQGARVLELGCGGGELLSLLVNEKKAEAQGLEIDEKAVYDCVAKGVSVLHGDIEAGLSEYGDKTFDFVILDRTFQELKNPDRAVKESLRVGKKVIVTFPNFLHLKSRLQMFFTGKVPVTASLPFEWYNTPNLHFLSIRDFSDYCRKRNIRIEKKYFTCRTVRIKILPNLLATLGIFQITQ